jgi:hypothetical protein
LQRPLEGAVSEGASSDNGLACRLSREFFPIGGTAIADEDKLGVSRIGELIRMAVEICQPARD